MYGVIDMLEYEENLMIVIIDLFVKWILKKYVYFLNWYVILMYNIIIRWKDVDRFEGLELLQMFVVVFKKSELQNDEYIFVFGLILVNVIDQLDMEKGEGGSEGDGDIFIEEE